MLQINPAKEGNLREYAEAAKAGDLLKSKPVRGSKYRDRLTKSKGAAPAKGFDADHVVELCVGGRDCAVTNGQWLESSPNRSAGSFIKNRIKNDPVGMAYGAIRIIRTLS